MRIGGKSLFTGGIFGIILIQNNSPLFFYGYAMDKTHGVACIRYSPTKGSITILSAFIPSYLENIANNCRRGNFGYSCFAVLHFCKSQSFSRIFQSGGALVLLVQKKKKSQYGTHAGIFYWRRILLEFDQHCFCCHLHLGRRGNRGNLWSEQREQLVLFGQLA